jgi:hemoglobin
MQRLLPLSAILALCACAPAVTHTETTPTHPAPIAEKSDALYRELGTDAGIARLVDATLARVHADLHIDLLFENHDLIDLRRLLIEQICAASGGPCTYTGRSMEETHSGMNLTNEDFDAFVGDLVAAMNDVKLPAATQQKVLGLFGPMRKDVVGQ